ncbi:MAG: hypothetical protein COT71_04180 [Candidatus Andersenbacteria bacterium CG10_big_fil_rev_8_21_14_0_10_54_11]|uniref:Uncharacterized protein n=1 Tax=Candidatus Andersenbacteria bacterium CG10_big_fil_rev_8_21_14_0_10_54_11 TaxID=1974485 RepID=A0A2M6WYB6_9BACT|nr:MAG: hypothetical protein COT71_04180 [Candidatus Andersenbacteria bacterium CG10_big_fil_rev_8_21_14_0_10_54_11]
MASPRERTPRERETLIFQTPEEAADFREDVGERLARERRGGVRRERETVAEAVADELERFGEGVAMVYRQPWDHSEEEHTAAQQLVDLAFEQDLPAALAAARRRADFPRIVDLFHDVLTGQLYDLLRQQGMTKLRLRGALAAGAAAAALLLAASLLLFIVGLLL